MLYAVILAGGKGERFWPLSRQLEPKQFLKVGRDKSLLQGTINRVRKLVPARAIFIITNVTYLYEIRKQIVRFNIPDANILIEPESRNTAAAIGWAAMRLYRKDPHATMIVLPSDHSILKRGEFVSALKKAAAAAGQGYLVTLGALPNYPATGYGYIKIAARPRAKGVVRVEKFIEKPDAARARQFFKDGRYYWNCGIFVWKADVILEELRQRLPAVYRCVSRINAADAKSLWKKIPSISIDYGILEKSKRVAMVPVDMGWVDLGSWKALDDVLKKDKKGNIFNADSLDIGSRDITVWAHNKLVATIGLNNLVIADTPDALLVCRKDESEKVKQIVELLKKKKRQEHLSHVTVKRPWGTFTVLESQAGFKIKLITVEAHQRLSLQYHRKRAEHWIVVAGKAKVQQGKRVSYAYPNQGIYIPVGKAHRLENPLDTVLKIVEVQTGSYFGEDDIVRIKDDYKRH